MERIVCYFTYFTCLIASPVAALLAIPYIYIICSYFCILSPSSGGVHFFFLRPEAGLTNRVPVRDSRAGAPLF
jgi:hypothetical protein